MPAVAAGAAGVEQVTALGPHGHGALAHGLGAAGDLAGCLTLGRQRRQERADLRLRGASAHDLSHDASGLILVQVVMLHDAADTLLD